MNQTDLSLHQAPPLAVPLRFLLSAPVFAAVAAASLLMLSADGLADRWNAWLLGSIHLLTLGFVSMTMLGALFQMLPVLAGAPVQRAQLWSLTVFALLAAGVVALAAGLWSVQSAPLLLAAWVLAAAVVCAIVVMLKSLMAGRAGNASVQAMKLALAAFAIAAAFGTLLTAGHAGALPLLRQFTALHIAWAAIGWVAILIIGVAYQVVPMFQMTGEYPAVLRRWLAPLLFAVLLAWSAVRIARDSLDLPALDSVAAILAVAVAALLGWFALATLQLQQRRRRRLVDVTLWYWRLGMHSLLGAIAVWIIAAVARSAVDAASTLLFTLYFLGFVVSVISGMLYKIVPFLVWLHSQRALQERGEWRGQVPTMKEIIPERQARRQFTVFVVGLVAACIAALGVNAALYAAAALVGASMLMLWGSLLNGVGVYLRFSRKS